MGKLIRDMSDHELLHACCKDDLRAYNELVERYASRLYKIGLQYLKDPRAVEELSMDLLFNIWERRHSLCIEGEVSAYLFRSLRYMIIRYLRKSLPAMLDVAELEEIEEPAGKAADHDLIARETETDYLSKLDKLSPQRRRVFELSRENNLSYADIAKQLNLSVNTVENYMVSALAFLREQYRELPLNSIVFGCWMIAIHYWC